MSEKKEFAEIEKKLQAMASPGIRPRTDHGGMAVCVLTVDSPVPADIANTLGERIGAQSVDSVSLEA